MIYGIGLPRTGTRSLSTALNLLNMNGKQYCEFLGGNKTIDKQDQFLVKNTFYKSILREEMTFQKVRSHMGTNLPSKSTQRISPQRTLPAQGEGKLPA